VPLRLEKASIVLALVGMPGSGKSTVGRQLARKLGVGFVDTDQVIELRIGCSIRDFFITGLDYLCHFILGIWVLKGN
jgi:shikimate kinase